MSPRTLNINLAGINLSLHTDTEGGYRILEEWLHDFRTAVKPEFFFQFLKDKTLFEFNLEQGQKRNSGSTAHMLVRMGQVDMEKGRAIGPDVSEINQGLARYIFSNFIRITLQYVIPQLNGLLVHASAVEHQGHGYIFVGPNDSGKSTLAKNTGKGVLSDDCVGFRQVNGCWNVYATPWGETTRNGFVPVKGMYFIKKSDQLKLKRADRVTSVKKLLASVCLSAVEDPSQNFDMMGKILHLAEWMSKDIPAFELFFRKQDNVFSIIEKRP